MKLTSFQVHQNTSTCARILTEYLRNTGRRPQTSERARKSPWNCVGQKKKQEKKRERERKESEWNLWPWEGAVKEESFLPAGKSARWRGDQSGQWGRFRALDENTTCLQQLEWRETCTDSQCLCPHSPVSDARLLGTGWGWVRKLGFQRSDPERGLGVGSVETG